jgi:hypothetical protein
MEVARPTMAVDITAKASTPGARKAMASSVPVGSTSTSERAVLFYATLRRDSDRWQPKRTARRWRSFGRASRRRNRLRDDVAVGPRRGVHTAKFPEEDPYLRRMVIVSSLPATLRASFR